MNRLVGLVRPVGVPRVGSLIEALFGAFATGFGFCGLVLLAFRVWEFMVLRVNAHVNENHVDIFTNPPNQMELLSYMSTALADKLPCPKLIWSPGP